MIPKYALTLVFAFLTTGVLVDSLQIGTRKAVVCEHRTQYIACGEGTVIYILTANYGRHSTSLCKHRSIRTTKCSATSSLTRVKEACQYRRSCNLEAKNEAFGDPCIGTYKYLAVEYYCRKSSVEYNNAVMCEHQRKTIKCGTGKVIQILRSLYGRTSRAICPHTSIRTTSCYARNSLVEVKRICDNKQLCTLYASNSVFGDPCKYTFKYLDVQYKCKTPNDEYNAVMCEHQRKTIKCGTGKVIQILRSLYGRTSRAICPHTSIRTTSCYARNSVVEVKKICDNKQLCTLYASNSVFGDPCKYTFKYLDVQYKCKTPNDEYNAVMCEHQRKTIKCGTGKVIQILRSLYGRTSRAICPHTSIRTTSCYARKSLVEVKKICDNKQLCTLYASNSVFGDPCKYTFKYLDVQYKCKTPNDEYNAVMCEHQRKTIKCGTGKVIQILRSLYGRTSRAICPHTSIRTTSCYARNSLVEVKKICDNKQLCTLYASNSVFGDPCKYTFKYLDVQYKCKKPDYGTRKAVVCEHRTQYIACGEGTVIYIVTANYGRHSTSLCKHRSIRTTKCSATSSLTRVKEACQYRRSCNLEAKNEAFGDPCIGTYKYLAVEYYCRKSSVVYNNAVLCEHQRKTINCGTGKVIRIISGLYGRRSRAICPHTSIKTTSCYAKTSLVKLRQTCDNRQQCAVYASNTVFGDPCHGTFKYLDLRYLCLKRVSECVTRQQCGLNANCLGGRCVCNNGCEGNAKTGCRCRCSANSALCAFGAYCQNGRCKCYPGLRGDGTKRCEIKCVCRASGDPHFRTYDHQMIHFQGICKYTLSKLTNPKDVCFFNVEVKNEHRRGNTRVSFVRSVDLTIYGVTIRLGPKKVVFVNGKRKHHFPFNLLQMKIKVFRRPSSVQVVTQCGVHVSFDGVHVVVVEVPSRFKNKMTGICGDCDGIKDDLRTKEGKHVGTNYAAIGHSYRVKDDSDKPDKRCEEATKPPVCNAELTNILNSDKYCGAITDPKGVFAACVKALEEDTIKEYYDSCKYDLCAFEGSDVALDFAKCKSLQAFADVCEENGINVNWRRNNFCPFVCGAHMTYRYSTSACPATCADPDAAENCEHSRVSGCVCDTGFLFSDDVCVPKSQCGCTDKDGNYYPLNAEVPSTECGIEKVCKRINGKAVIIKNGRKCHPNADCKLDWDGERRCVCRKGFHGNGYLCKALCGGKYNCHKHAVCSAGRCVCRRHLAGDGIKNCERTCTCSASGDPHYRTYDGLMIHFMGPCRYTLTKSVGTEPECGFNIEVKNEPRREGKVSVTRIVYVQLHQHTIKIGRNRKIYVNGRHTFLPVNEKYFKIFISSNTVRVLTKCGVVVTWNWQSTVIVDVPKRFANKLKGICGNCNGERTDDMIVNGKDVSKLENRYALLGQSFSVYNNDENEKSKCNTAVTPDPCTANLREKAKRVKICGYLHPDNNKAGGPLSQCVIADKNRALEFYESCVFDYCSYANIPEEVEDIVCDAIDGFVEECYNNGFTIAWRSPTFCPIKCGVNMTYSDDVPGCPATCSQSISPVVCALPPTDGCKCKDGYLLSDGRCVKASDCGCRTDTGNYFPLGEKVVSGDCTTVKKCVIDNGLPVMKILVRDKRCHKFAVCQLVDGDYACVCTVGYRGDGVHTCEKVECVADDDCGANAKCVSGKCSCNTGCNGEPKTGCNCYCDVIQRKNCGKNAVCDDGKCKCVNGYGGDVFSECLPIMECLKTKKGEEYIGTISMTANGKTCQRWDSQKPHKHRYTGLASSENYCRNTGDSSKPWCYTTDPNTRWAFCSIPMCDQKKPECTHHREVQCSSWNYKRAFCEISDAERITFIKVVKKHSQSECVFGESFGRHGDMIMVQKGCRATFMICYIPEVKTPILPPEGECKKSLKGAEYDGKWDRTESGVLCQSWDSQYPHKHGQTKKMKPGDKNYCRNYDNSARPWCYTSDPGTRWEYCNLPMCDKPKDKDVDECLKTEKGKEYKGYIATTKGGLTCQRWDLNFPHKHRFDKKLASDSNYCRNPDGEPSPWCYTTDPKVRYQLCNIPACSECIVSESVEKCTATYTISGKCFYKSNFQNHCRYTVEVSKIGGKAHAIIKAKNKQKTLKNGEKMADCATFSMKDNVLTIQDKICSKDCPDEE